MGDASDTKGNGCPDNMALILPRGGFDNTAVTLWSPVCRDDIAWNFEKFLVGKDGKVIERFSRFFPTADIAPHIEKAIAA
jgi:glutathione peroxidase-family protein